MIGLGKCDKGHDTIDYLCPTCLSQENADLKAKLAEVERQRDYAQKDRDLVYKCNEELGRQLSESQAACAAMRRVMESEQLKERCAFTSNPSGTDTWLAGTECSCGQCQRWIARNNVLSNDVGRDFLARLETAERQIEAANDWLDEAVGDYCKGDPDALRLRTESCVKKLDAAETERDMHAARATAHVARAERAEAKAKLADQLAAALRPFAELGCPESSTANYHDLDETTVVYGFADKAITAGDCRAAARSVAAYATLKQPEQP